jgi:hypothetical protein
VFELLEALRKQRSRETRLALQDLTETTTAKVEVSDD